MAKIKEFFLRVFKVIKTHKFLSVIFLIIIIAAGYYNFNILNKDNISQEIIYKTQAVAKGIVINSVTGTGYVSALNQVDLKPEVLAKITKVNVKAGDIVKIGDILVQLDATDAYQSVREAQANLEIARLDYNDLLSPSDDFDIQQAQTALDRAKSDLEQVESDYQIDLTKANNDLYTLITDQKLELDRKFEEKEQAEKNLEDKYNDIYTTLTSVFLELPTVMANLNTILYGTTISSNHIPGATYDNNNSLYNTTEANDQYDIDKLIDKAKDSFNDADDEYQDIYDQYLDADRDDSHEELIDLLENTSDNLISISKAIKDISGVYDFWIDSRTKNDNQIFSTVTTYKNNLSSYTGSINSDFSSLTSLENSISSYEQDIVDADRDLDQMAQTHPIDLADAKQNIIDLETDYPINLKEAENTIVEKQNNLDDLLAGADEIDIKNKQLTLYQRQNTLTKAYETLADYSVKAPFDGKVASVDAVLGDSASSSTALATLVTDQKLAEITLNEIDATKVKTGQKATLTFDAVDELTITGQVAEVDLVGTTSQSVVSYSLKISFDVDDERIKPGMTVSASIIIDSKQNVLTVPLSSVKTSGTASYVEILNNGQPERKIVTVGLENDTLAEIVSGLNEGEEVITSSSSSSGTASSSSSQSGFGGPGGGGEFRALMR